MNKVLLTRLCIIMLLVGSVIVLTSVSSKVQPLTSEIIIEDADYVSTNATEYSSDLIDIAKNVTPRVVLEYGESITIMDLYKSAELDEAAGIVSPRMVVEYADSIFEYGLQGVTVPNIAPRIIVEYADYIFEHGLQGSQDLVQLASAVKPRIIVEYADSIISTNLERPMFGVEVSARIDSYSISPRNVTVGDAVTIGFSFTNTGNVSWTFGAGATLRKPDGTRIDFLKPVTVNPAASGSAQWTYIIDMAGRWDTVFGVWRESTHPLENLLVQTGWVSEYITAIQPGPQPILTFDLSPGWQTKELFVPIYYRSREEPGKFVLGVHNRRDMWYLVEVYRRRPNQDWERIYPWDLPYLQPWGERTFSYTPQVGDEIKIAVWNDLNDEALRNLWVLDFTTRTIFGVSISPQVTNPQEFKVKLTTFYNEILTAVGYMRIGEWKKAALELGNKLASLTAREALVNVLKHVGIEVTTETINTLLIPFRYIKNILSTGAWRLITNANKEPFTEEVIFTAKEKISPAVPDVRVTKGLTIVQREPYSVGQTITAQFTITNRGTAPITFNILTVGGRGPKGDVDVRDFTFKTDITLNAGDSYNYEGELKLLDNGTYHFFIAYQTPDGKWETSVPAEAGTTNTVDIFVNPIPEKWLAADLGSPAELRVYDSQDRITGMTNGVEKIEIPYSTYYENIVVILAPADSYKYEVVGTGEGSYSLMIINGTVQEIATFNATDIPTSASAIHRYTIDWVTLTRGGKGVTVQIDSNGDGIFEKAFTSDNELTRDEFIFQVRPEEAFPMWIVGVAVAAIAIATASTVVFWRKRKHLTK